MQKIVTGAAGEAVIAKAALHRIIAEPGNHHVIAGAGIDGIGIAAVAVVQRIDPVALGVGQIAGIDGVIAGGALDNEVSRNIQRQIVERDAGQRLGAGIIVGRDGEIRGALGRGEGKAHFLPIGRRHPGAVDWYAERLAADGHVQIGRARLVDRAVGVVDVIVEGKGVGLARFNRRGQRSGQPLVVALVGIHRDVASAVRRIEIGGHPASGPFKTAIGLKIGRAFGAGPACRGLIAARGGIGLEDTVRNEICHRSAPRDPGAVCRLAV